MAVEYISTGAVVSQDLRYRYELHRQWKDARDPKLCVFIMLNPSTADDSVDDPTIRKCVGFSRLWNYDKLVVVNLFAYRATRPADLLRLDAIDDPVGPLNAHHVREVLKNVDRVVCAWGALGCHMRQGETMMRWIDATGIRPVCLGITKYGEPNHPLYLPYGQPISKYNPL